MVESQSRKMNFHWMIKKLVGKGAILAVICFIVCLAFQISLKHSDDIFSNFEHVANVDDFKIDWHDHKFMIYEATRVGPGENGAPVKLNAKELKASSKGRTYGINELANEKISPNRSLPDVRHEV